MIIYKIDPTPTSKTQKKQGRHINEFKETITTFKG